MSTNNVLSKGQKRAHRCGLRQAHPGSEDNEKRGWLFTILAAEGGLPPYGCSCGLVGRNREKVLFATRPQLDFVQRLGRLGRNRQR